MGENQSQLQHEQTTASGLKVSSWVLLKAFDFHSATLKKVQLKTSRSGKIRTRSLLVERHLCYHCAIPYHSLSYVIT